MDIKQILSFVDHTLLSQVATWEQIKQTCIESIEFKTASVCIPPSYVARANLEFGKDLNVCTVIGFPNGYNHIETKLFETQAALEFGANEIDMVINIGELKAKNYDYVFNEIHKIKKICGKKTLKVIVETCLLEPSEKIKACEIVTMAKADFIKTSTGFSVTGATKEDIILLKKHIGKNVLIKAAGGITTLKDAEDFINLGCKRLGTSKIIKLAKNENTTGY